MRQYNVTTDSVTRTDTVTEGLARYADSHALSNEVFEQLVCMEVGEQITIEGTTFSRIQ